jgi:hypothetical protein
LCINENPQHCLFSRVEISLNCNTWGHLIILGKRFLP